MKLLLHIVSIASILVAQTAKAADEVAKPGLKLTLKCEPTKLVTGDKVVFVCTVRNDTGKDIQLASWGIMDISPALELRDADGKVIPFRGGRDATRRLNADAFPMIKNGESKDFTLNGTIFDNGSLGVFELMGGVWEWKTPPGKYTLHAVFQMEARREEISKRFTDIKPEVFWTGKARSEGVAIEIAQKK